MRSLGAILSCLISGASSIGVVLAHTNNAPASDAWKSPMTKTSGVDMQFLPIQGGNERLAYHYSSGSSPAVLFCPGFQSSMYGKKAIALEEYCQERGNAFCRFDYRGHGASSGNFEDSDYTLSDWIFDASCIIKDVVLPKNEVVVLVGSSMGAWISLRLALELSLQAKILAILGIAAAPDFLEDIYENSSAAQQEEWRTKGVVYMPTEYDSSPYPISWALIEDAREKWNLLRSYEPNKIPIYCKVRLIHGLQDKDIQWQKSVDLADKLETNDVILTLIKSGDHRLSQPEHLERIKRVLDESLECDDGEFLDVDRATDFLLL